MIIKPFTYKSGKHVTRLANHLCQTGDDNELAQVIDVRGMAERPDLNRMLRHMHRARNVTSGKRGLFHVAISPDNDNAHSMSSEDWEHCAASVEREFNLTNQPRVIVLHHKKQDDGTTRPHIHVIYQTADVQKRRQVDGFGQSKRRCVRIARQLERELGHRRLRDRAPVPSYTLGDQRQAERAGHSVTQRRAIIAEAWNATQDAATFQNSLKRLGYDMAQGKRLCVVLPDGGHVRLTTELRGTARAKEIRDRFGGHELEPLDQVKAQRRRLAEFADTAPTLTDNAMRDDELEEAARVLKQRADDSDRQRVKWIGQRTADHVEAGLSIHEANTLASREYLQMLDDERSLEAQRQQDQTADRERGKKRLREFVQNEADTSYQHPTQKRPQPPPDDGLRVKRKNAQDVTDPEADKLKQQLKQQRERRRNRPRKR